MWAIEQDGLSKRYIPTESADAADSAGQDVFVPWVLASQTQLPKPKPRSRKRKGQESRPEEDAEAQQEDVKDELPPPVFNRYYHMFAKGELSALVEEAANELGLEFGPKPNGGKGSRRGIHIVKEGWERSNYYTEFSRWECT